MSADKFGRYKAEAEVRTGRTERLALRNNVKSEKRLRDKREIERRDIMKTHLHGPMDFAKAQKLRCRVRVSDLDLPERRKRYTGSREEEVDAQMCPCGKAVDSRTYIVGECEMYNEERDV